MSTRRWTTAAAGAAALTATVLAPPAHAGTPEDSGVVSRVVDLNAWIFFDAGLLLFTGPPVEEGCDQPLSVGDYTVVTAPSGQSVSVSAYHDDVHVYDSLGVHDPFAWIGIACSAPAGERPVPLASGEGVISSFTRVVDGVPTGHGTVTATLTTVDGGRAHVTARGDTTSFDDDVIRYVD